MSAITSNRRPALLLGDGDVEVALLVGLHLGLIDRREPRGAEEAGDRLLRRADLRTLALLLHVRLLHRHAVHGQRQPPRRHEGPGALIDEAGGDQAVGDHLLEVVGRARLHARRDFFGEQFEQKVGHRMLRLGAVPLPPRALASGGEGSGVGGNGAGVHRRGDNRQNALSVRQYIVIPKSQDAVAIRAQECVSRSITRRLLVHVHAGRHPIQSPVGSCGTRSPRSKARSLPAGGSAPCPLAIAEVLAIASAPHPSCRAADDAQWKRACPPDAPHSLLAPHPRPLPTASRGEGSRSVRVQTPQPAPPPSVASQASPQALASSRTRRM